MTNAFLVAAYWIALMLFLLGVIIGSVFLAYFGIGWMLCAFGALWHRHHTNER